MRVTLRTMSAKNKGIIIILVGIGVLFISIFFSSGSDPKLNLMGNISKMVIVLDEGTYTETARKFPLPPYVYHEGGVYLPLKYPLSLSVLLILLGTGIVLLSKNEETKV